jgi:hypothetical protein
VGLLGLDSKVGWVEAGVRLSWVPGPLCSAWCFTLLWINIFLPAYPTRELVGLAGFEGRGVPGRSQCLNAVPPRCRL